MHLTGKQTLIYNFSTAVDLTYKADGFITELRKLDSLAVNLNANVKNELANSDGKIVEKALETIQKQTDNNRLFYNAYQTSMKTMAGRYTNIVNDMNSQQVTLYYDIISMNGDK